MKLLKKTNKLKYFWVEDYSDEQKDFFIKLGFKETIKTFMGEIMDRRLSFDGSAFIRTWNDQEWKTITTAVRAEFGICRIHKLTLYELM